MEIEQSRSITNMAYSEIRNRSRFLWHLVCPELLMVSNRLVGFSHGMSPRRNHKSTLLRRWRVSMKQRPRHCMYWMPYTGFIINALIVAVIYNRRKRQHQRERGSLRFGHWRVCACGTNISPNSVTDVHKSGFWRRISLDRLLGEEQGMDDIGCKWT